MDVSMIKPMLEAYAKAKIAKSFHANKVNEYKRACEQFEEQFAQILGAETEGLVGNQLAIRRSPTDQFAKAEFAKKYPDLARQCTVEVPKQVLDTDMLKQLDPAVYEEFLVTRWYNYLEPEA